VLGLGAEEEDVLEVVVVGLQDDEGLTARMSASNGSTE
jgi:hypothetical protein